MPFGRGPLIATEALRGDVANYQSIIAEMKLLKSNPLLSIFNSYLVDAPVPSNLSYLWNYESLLGLCLVIQIITGVTLAMHYTPTMIQLLFIIFTILLLFANILKSSNNLLGLYPNYSGFFIRPPPGHAHIDSIRSKLRIESVCVCGPGGGLWFIIILYFACAPTPIINPKDL